MRRLLLLTRQRRWLCVVLVTVALVVMVRRGRRITATAGNSSDKSSGGQGGESDTVWPDCDQLPNLLSPHRAVSACQSVRAVQEARDSGKGAGKHPAVSLTFVGDVSFARDVQEQLERAGDDTSACSSVFQHVQPMFSASDLVIANLESPALDASSPDTVQEQKRISLAAHEKHLRCLSKAGISMVSLANNHMLDFGDAAFRSTLAELRRLSVSVIGATAGGTHVDSSDEDLSVKTIHGIKIGFLAFCQVKACRTARSHANVGPRLATSLEEMLSAITTARSQVDVLVVVMHWGREYFTRPSQHQRSQAAAMTNAGAHVVVGHHQHVVQDHSLGSNNVVLYGLGNFVFDSHVCRDASTYAIKYSASPACMALPPPLRPLVSEDVARSRIYSVRLNRFGVVSAEYLPVRITHPDTGAAGGGTVPFYGLPPPPIRPLFQPRQLERDEYWHALCSPHDPYCLQCGDTP